MFLNPVWSLLLLIAAVAMYLAYIRPKLHEQFPEAYAELDGFWASVWFVIKNFKKTVVLIIGTIITAAPDLLVQIAPLDFSHWLPQPWAAYTGPICTMIVTLMRVGESRS